MLIMINIDIVAIYYMAQTHIKRIPVLPSITVSGHYSSTLHARFSMA